MDLSFREAFFIFIITQFRKNGEKFLGARLPKARKGFWQAGHFLNKFKKFDQNK